MEGDLTAKTRISVHSYQKVKDTNLGKSTVELFDLGTCEIRLTDDKGDGVSIKRSFFGGRFPSGKNINKTIMPSLLGMDFFEENNFGITTRDNAGKRYLYTD